MLFIVLYSHRILLYNYGAIEINKHLHLHFSFYAAQYQTVMSSFPIAILNQLSSLDETQQTFLFNPYFISDPDVSFPVSCLS